MTCLHTLLVVLLVGAVAAFGSGLGCSTLTGTEDNRNVEQVAAEVDSLDVPARISPSDTLTVRMHGTVGSNSCYSFDHFDVERSTQQLRVTPVVQHVVEEGAACLTVVIPVNEAYTAAPPFEEGTLTVVVPQPDQPAVTVTTEVQ